MTRDKERGFVGLMASTPGVLRTYRYARWQLGPWLREHLVRPTQLAVLRPLAMLLKRPFDVSCLYDTQFYENTIEKAGPSASTVVDLLEGYFAPSKVIDVGCGVGFYLAEFCRRGVKVFGCDASSAAVRRSLIPREFLMQNDLRYFTDFNRAYDLCLCTEVAEHLEAKYADVLVETLTTAADIVVFTAAAPGQGGTDHLNEKPKEYWINKFADCEFQFDAPTTSRLSREMTERGVVWWLPVNLMIFRRSRADNVRL